MPPLYGWPGGLSAYGELATDRPSSRCKRSCGGCGDAINIVTSGSQDHLGDLMHGRA